MTPKQEDNPMTKDICQICCGNDGDTPCPYTAELVANILRNIRHLREYTDDIAMDYNFNDGTFQDYYSQIESLAQQIEHHSKEDNGKTHTCCGSTAKGRME